MFQNFDVTTRPENGPKRLAKLRKAMKSAGVDGFLVPRSDAHRGENVSPRDERLSWLTGFTGSASLKNIPDDKLPDWVRSTLIEGQTLAYDPWLQTKGEIDDLTKHTDKAGINLIPSDNLVDAIWEDQPENRRRNPHSPGFHRLAFEHSRSRYPTHSDPARLCDPLQHRRSRPLRRRFQDLRRNKGTSWQAGPDP